MGKRVKIDLFDLYEQELLWQGYVFLFLLAAAAVAFVAFVGVALVAWGLWYLLY